MLRPDRAGLAAVGTMLLVAVALLAVVLAPGRSATMSERTDAVAATLKCPTCQGETVADSDTPIARSMRAEVRHQLEAGRRPDDVRTWFRNRYGDGIVVVPATDGWQQVWWWLPALTLAAGASIVVVRLRSSRRRTGPHAHAGRLVTAHALPGARLGVVAGVVAVVAVAVPVAVRHHATSREAPSATSASPSSSSSTSTSIGRRDLSVADWKNVAVSLEKQGEYAGAVRAYRNALRSQPSSKDLRTSLAFALVRDDRPAAAERAVVAATRGARPHPLAVLVLGLAQRAQHDPSAGATLRRFLKIAPNHPAAAQVRRLLRST